MAVGLRGSIAGAAAPRATAASRWAVLPPLLLLAVYLAQVGTPLRLTVDSIHYLSTADSIASGHGVPPHSAFPVGLPGLYALLVVAGVGHSWAIAMLNVVCVAVAVYCAIWIYRLVFGIGRETSLLLVCGMLLSYVLVEHAALALSDVPFVAVTTGSLLALTLATHQRSRRRFVALTMAIVLVLGAITIRSAGAALVPAALFAVVEAARGQIPIRRWWRTSSAGIWCAGVVVVLTSLGLVLSGSRYFGEASIAYGRRSFASLLVGHIRDWGEVGLNVPAHRLPSGFDPGFVVAGLAILGIVVAGLWRERRRFEPVHLFTVTYLALVFAWPYGDPRFWLPLVPVVPAYAYVVLRPLVTRRVVAILIGAYAAFFASAGVVALGNDTRLTHAGMRFPDRYGSYETRAETLLPTYRVAFGEARPGDRRKTNTDALAILREWEPMARPRQ